MRAGIAAGPHCRPSLAWAVPCRCSGDRPAAPSFRRPREGPPPIPGRGTVRARGRQPVPDVPDAAGVAADFALHAACRAFAGPGMGADPVRRDAAPGPCAPIQKEHGAETDGPPLRERSVGCPSRVEGPGSPVLRVARLCLPTASGSRFAWLFGRDFPARMSAFTPLREWGNRLFELATISEFVSEFQWLAPPGSVVFALSIKGCCAWLASRAREKFGGYPQGWNGRWTTLAMPVAALSCPKKERPFDKLRASGRGMPVPLPSLLLRRGRRAGPAGAGGAR
jgi:hypothetical protein